MPTTRSRRRRDDEVIDVEGAEYSGSRRSAHLPEDENPFTFRVAKGEVKTGGDSGKKYIEWQLTVDRGEFKGKRIYHTTSLQEKALFNLRGMIEACGVTVRNAKAAEIIKRLTGKTFVGNVMDDEYDNKIKSVLDDYVIGGDDEEDEDEDEAPAKRSSGSSRTPSRAKGRSRRRSDEEEEEEEEDEEEEEEEEEEDDEDEDEDEDEEEEEEEEPAPKRRSRSTKTSASSGRTRGKSSSSRQSSGRRGGRSRDDDEDLDEIDLDDL